MDSQKNKLSLMFGIPGIILQIGGVLLAGTLEPGTPAAGAAVLGGYAVGTLLLLCGLGYYAQAKGRSALWCLMAFLGIIGLIVLATLSDRTLGRTDIAHVGGHPGGIASSVIPDGLPNIRTSSLAVWSLILGILSIPFTVCIAVGFLFAIPAIILGHLSRRAIRREPTMLKGSGLALAGLITGYIGGVLGAALIVAIILRT